ncbi:MAG: hypothetical protein ABI210_07510 [Abditibacteriaceae bacterium]
MNGAIAPLSHLKIKKPGGAIASPVLHFDVSFCISTELRIDVVLRHSQRATATEKSSDYDEFY